MNILTDWIKTINWSRWLKKIVELFNTVKLKTPRMFYEGARVVVASMAIILSLVSFLRLTNKGRLLLADKTYVGNELYLISVILMLMVCVLIMALGFKRIMSGFIYILKEPDAIPVKFDDYQEVEERLVQEKLPASQSKVNSHVELHETSFRRLLLCLGVVIFFWVGKRFIPEEFFWNYRLTPGYFSFPVIFVLILSVAAALRLASIYFYRSEQLEDRVDEKIISIKGADHPSVFAPVIEKALLSLQVNGIPNTVVHFGFNEMDENNTDTGKIDEELFIETAPSPIRCNAHSIEYVNIVFAVFLYIGGFVLLTKLPPDNISVLSVPTIAIGYLWTLLKGGVLILCGGSFLRGVSSIFRRDWFESIMIYVNIRGITGRTIVRSGNGLRDSVETRETLVRSDCHFWIYSAKLVTEVDIKKGKRHIVKRTVDENSEKAKRLIAGAIESLKKGRESEPVLENTKKILILSANPRGTSRLRLDMEVREIEEGLKRSKCRGNFEIQTKWAVRYRDLRRSLLECEPHIVHFSGHGDKSGIVLEDNDTGIAAPISKSAITGLFKLSSDHVKCVILNACHSVSQVNSISRYIDYVVGIPGNINDEAAIEFSVGFYDALGAGKSVEKAYEFGCIAIYQKNPTLPGDLMPVLKKSRVH